MGDEQYIRALPTRVVVFGYKPLMVFAPMPSIESANAFWLISVGFEFGVGTTARFLFPAIVMIVTKVGY